MHAPDVLRRTEVLEGVGDLGVAFVVDPHKAELDQATTQCDLGVDDFAGVGEFHGEWLLGEDRHAALETGHHVPMVKAIGTGDDERPASSMRSMPSATHSQPSSSASACPASSGSATQASSAPARSTRGGHDRPPCRRHR